MTTSPSGERLDLTAAPLGEVIAGLATDVAHGLTDGETQTRLGRIGPNEIPERPPHPLRDFLKKFWGLSAWMLELIMVLSWLLHK